MFTPLSIKTHYSEGDSIIPINILVRRASQLGFKSLGMADFDNIFKINTFYEMCKKEDIKPVIGTELRLKEGNFIIIIKNQTGYYNLADIMLKKDLDNFSFDTLIKHQNGLAFILPMLESEIKPNKNLDQIIAKYKKFDELYFEIRRDSDNEIALNQEYINIAKKYGLKLIANSKITHLQKDTFKMLNTIKKSKRPKLTEYFYSGTYLKVPEEYEGFIKEAIINNQNLVESIEELDVWFFDFGDKMEALKSIVEPKLQNLLHNVEEYKKESLQWRFNEEMSLIKKYSLSGYFLELVKIIKNLKNYEIDSLKHSLILTLLLDKNITNFDSFKVPLIVLKDLNIEHLKQKNDYKFIIKHSAVAVDKFLDVDYYIDKVGNFLNLSPSDIECFHEYFDWEMVCKYATQIVIDLDEEPKKIKKTKELKIALTKEEELMLFIYQIMDLIHIEDKKYKLFFKKNG